LKLFQQSIKSEQTKRVYLVYLNNILNSQVQINLLNVIVQQTIGR
jgi:hypothetical protein